MIVSKDEIIASKDAVIVAQQAALDALQKTVSLLEGQVSGFSFRRWWRRLWPESMKTINGVIGVFGVLGTVVTALVHYSNPVFRHAWIAFRAYPLDYIAIEFEAAFWGSFLLLWAIHKIPGVLQKDQTDMDGYANFVFGFMGSLLGFYAIIYEAHEASSFRPYGETLYSLMAPVGTAVASAFLLRRIKTGRWSATRLGRDGKPRVLEIDVELVPRDAANREEYFKDKKARAAASEQ